MALAQSRAHRSDVGTTATWHYPGDGPTIVLVHGFRGDHHGLSAIAGALHDFNVVIPDLPGYGRSPVFAGTHDLDAYGRWLITFLAELGGNPYVLGHSFGSLIALEAASRLKERATHLVLVGTAYPMKVSPALNLELLTQTIGTEPITAAVP
jgi:pimeloyl-ACP methyl ester carboxylesterase